jgi:alanine dehydrogenase
VTYPFIEALAELGLDAACRKFEGLADGVNMFAGKLSCQAVAEAHGLPFTAFAPGQN